MSATYSTPCPHRPGNTCFPYTTLFRSVCDQNHMTQPCPGPDECNGGCDPTTGQSGRAHVWTPVTKRGRMWTTAGSKDGVCVQTHTSATDSTPCPDSDGNACTTAGCNGA